MKIRDLLVPFEDELQLLPSSRVPNPPLIEWKSAFGDLFFRAKGMEPEVLWCVLQDDLSLKRLSRAWYGCRYFRVVPFDEKGDWMLLRPKFAFVKSPQQPHGAFLEVEAPFTEKMTQRKWLEKPQPQLCDEMRASQGDLSLQMARHCAALDETERYWSHRSSTCLMAREKWQQLVFAVLVLATPASQLPMKWIFLPRNSVEGPLDFDCVHGQLRRVQSHFWSPLHPKGKTLFRIVQRHIALPFWRGLDARGRRRQPTFLRDSLEMSSISSHERLESALLWRDFAREIGKSDEIEALLNELLR